MRWRWKRYNNTPSLKKSIQKHLNSLLKWNFKVKHPKKDLFVTNLSVPLKKVSKKEIVLITRWWESSHLKKSRLILWSVELQVAQSYLTTILKQSLIMKKNSSWMILTHHLRLDLHRKSFQLLFQWSLSSFRLKNSSNTKKRKWK